MYEGVWGGGLIYRMSVMNVAWLVFMAGYSIPQKVTSIEIPMSNLILVIESNGKRVSDAFARLVTLKRPVQAYLWGG